MAGLIRRRYRTEINTSTMHVSPINHRQSHCSKLRPEVLFRWCGIGIEELEGAVLVAWLSPSSWVGDKSLVKDSQHAPDPSKSGASCSAILTASHVVRLMVVLSVWHPLTSLAVQNFHSTLTLFIYFLASLPNTKFQKEKDFILLIFEST